MAAITSASALFSPALVADIFSKVKGHSALAALSGQTPVPFSGIDTFVFNMDGEASIVGEGKDKPAGQAALSSVTIKPIKFVYQHRVTDEFLKISEEKQLPYIEALSDGFTKKIARAIDIAAFHGVNPFDNTASDIVGTNNFDSLVTETVTFDASEPDSNIDDAASALQTAGGIITGIAMSPEFGAALGAMKTGSEHVAMYPDFRFGGTPSAFSGIPANVNNTLSFGSSLDRAIIGDFANAFRWGYAENVALEVIQYGDPDGQGDLKRANQICFRVEAYVGWGILDKSSFVRIVSSGE